MQSSELQYPVLQVSIGGAPVDKRPAAFRLATDAALPAVMARLSYPSDVPDGNAGEDITISLLAGETESLLFTGKIYNTKVHGAYRDLDLTDGYKLLCGTVVVPAYRKETAKVILQDALDAAGIGDTKITCPAAVLDRFSTDAVTADRCIQLLIHALGEYNETGLKYFFDAENVFRFGRYGDTGKNEGPDIILETGKNIIRTGDGWVEILPLPVRHSQAVSVNGTALKTIRTELLVSQRTSRLVLWVRGAA
jgi:hypothetical protein